MRLVRVGAELDEPFPLELARLALAWLRAALEPLLRLALDPLLRFALDPLLRFALEPLLRVALDPLLFVALEPLLRAALEPLLRVALLPERLAALPLRDEPEPLRDEPEEACEERPRLEARVDLPRSLVADMLHLPDAGRNPRRLSVPHQRVCMAWATQA